MTYGDLEGPGTETALVPLDCNNNGGTAGGALLYSIAVFSGVGGKLHTLGLIKPVMQGQGSATLLQLQDVQPGRVTVREFFYGPHDGTCCPSGEATTRWMLRNGSLVSDQPMVTTTARETASP